MSLLPSDSWVLIYLQSLRETAPEKKVFSSFKVCKVSYTNRESLKSVLFFQVYTELWKLRQNLCQLQIKILINTTDNEKRFLLNQTSVAKYVL